MKSTLVNKSLLFGLLLCAASTAGAAPAERPWRFVADINPVAKSFSPVSVCPQGDRLFASGSAGSLGDEFVEINRSNGAVSALTGLFAGTDKRLYFGGVCPEVSSGSLIVTKNEVAGTYALETLRVSGRTPSLTSLLESSQSFFISDYNAGLAIFSKSEPAPALPQVWLTDGSNAGTQQIILPLGARPTSSRAVIAGGFAVIPITGPSSTAGLHTIKLTDLSVSTLPGAWQLSRIGNIGMGVSSNNLSNPILFRDGAMLSLDLSAALGAPGSVSNVTLYTFGDRFAVYAVLPNSSKIIVSLSQSGAILAVVSVPADSIPNSADTLIGAPGASPLISLIRRSPTSNSQSPRNEQLDILEIDPTGLRLQTPNDEFPAFTATEIAGKILRQTGALSYTQPILTDLGAAKFNPSPRPWAIGRQILIRTNDQNRHGEAIFLSNGTPSGTFELGNVTSQTLSSDPIPLGTLGNKLIFTAATGSDGIKLLSTPVDGGGITELARIGLQSERVNYINKPANRVNGRDVLYVLGQDGPRGDISKLWRTDGTSAGTKLLRTSTRDMNVGRFSIFEVINGVPVVQEYVSGQPTLFFEVMDSGLSEPLSFTSEIGQLIPQSRTRTDSSVFIIAKNTSGALVLCKPDVRNRSCKAVPFEAIASEDFGIAEGCGGYVVIASNSNGSGDQRVLALDSNLRLVQPEFRIPRGAYPTDDGFVFIRAGTSPSQPTSVTFRGCVATDAEQTIISFSSGRFLIDGRKFKSKLIGSYTGEVSANGTYLIGATGALRISEELLGRTSILDDSIYGFSLDASREVIVSDGTPSGTGRIGVPSNGPSTNFSLAGERIYFSTYAALVGTELAWMPSSAGLSSAACQRDTDKDGTRDCQDLCPIDPAKVDPLVCGCGVADSVDERTGVYKCALTNSLANLVPSKPRIVRRKGSTITLQLQNRPGVQYKIVMTGKIPNGGRKTKTVTVTKKVSKSKVSVRLISKAAKTDFRYSFINGNDSSKLSARVSVKR